MRLKTIFLSIILSIVPLTLFWAGTEEAYNLYEERAEDICSDYEIETLPLYEEAIYKKAEEYKPTQFSDAESKMIETDVIWNKSFYAFDKAQELYNKTISNQFKCAY